MGVTYRKDGESGLSAMPMVPAKMSGFLVGSPAARAAVVVCLLVSPAAFTQNAVTQMVWTGPGPRVVAGVVVFFAVAAVCVVLFYAAISRKRGKSEEELSAKLFGEGCQRCRLTREEANVLFGIAAFVTDHLVKGHLVFESLPIYERCLDSYALRTLHHQAHKERIAEQDEILASLRRKLGYGILGPEQHLASTRNIGVGQKVTLIVPGPGAQRARSVGAMVSHVGEFWFTVRIVEDFGGIINLVGSEMTVAFLRQGDSPYSVTAKVRDQGHPGEINFYHTIKFSRNQNRQYMRFDINLPIKYRVIEKIDSEERAFSEVYSAHTVDISGGGICFISDTPLQSGDVILLTMNIPGATLSGIRSKILKVITVEGKTSTRYRHLVQFVLIEQQQREKIVKFIFDKQRALLQMR